MAKLNFVRKVTSLHVDDVSIRLLQTSRKRVEKWAEFSPGFSILKDSPPEAEAEIAEKIRRLFEQARIRSRKVAVSLSGLHCMVRPLTLPPLPGKMLEEAISREAERELPVPLKELYISWRVMPAPNGQTNVLLVGIPRHELDGLIRILHLAGVKPHMAELKPFALTRLVTEKTALVIDVQPTECDIVIVSDGVPQLVRTISLPSGSQSERLQLVKDEVGRTVQFYQSNNQDKISTPGTPIFVGGELTCESDFAKGISTMLNSQVRPLSVLLDSPQQFATNRFSSNIALNLKVLDGKSEASRLSLNILPVQYRPRAVSLATLIVLPGVTLAIGLFLTLGTMVQASSEDVTWLRKQEALTSELLAKRQSMKLELTRKITDLQKQVTRQGSAHESLVAALDNLRGLRTNVNADLKTVVDSTTALTLDRISHDGTKVVIEGRVTGAATVLSYAKQMRDTGQFSEVLITNIKVGNNGEIFFGLVLKTKG